MRTCDSKHYQSPWWLLCTLGFAIMRGSLAVQCVQLPHTQRTAWCIKCDGKICRCGWTFGCTWCAGYVHQTGRAVGMAQRGSWLVQCVDGSLIATNVSRTWTFRRCVCSAGFQHCACLNSNSTSDISIQKVYYRDMASPTSYQESIFHRVVVILRREVLMDGYFYYILCVSLKGSLLWAGEVMCICTP